MEIVRSKTATAWKLAEEGVDLLRKAKEEMEVSRAKACRLAEGKAIMAVEKEKAKEEVTCLRQEL